MTSNKSMAFEIMGFIPVGYIMVSEVMNTNSKNRIGCIYVNGKAICSFIIK